MHQEGPFAPQAASSAGPRHQPDLPVVQHVTYNLYRPKHVVIGQGITVGFQALNAKDNSALCPDSMLIALLKEILYRCPGRKEALHCLEQKLLSGLRDKAGLGHFTSLEECRGISFREFLAKQQEHFCVEKEGAVLVVTRVADTLKKSLAPSTQSTDNAWSKPRPLFPQDPPVHGQKSHDADTTPTKPSGNLFPPTLLQETGTEPLRKETNQPLSKGKDDQNKKKSCRKQNEVQSTKPDSQDEFITICLNTAPHNSLMFKVSAEGYKRDGVQFTQDVVSMWNTPDRDKAYIIIGVKPLVSLPHQLVGLRSPAVAAYYQNMFQKQYFETAVDFSYREVMHDGKRVGIIQIENNAESITPCVVTKKTSKKSKLSKDQLWVRKDGNNVAVKGSDMENPMVRKVYSWVLQTSPRSDSDGQGSLNVLHVQSQQPVASHTADEDAECVGPGSVNDSSSTEDAFDSDGKNTPPREECLDNSQTDPACQAVADSNLPSELMKALQHFKNGHFVLLCGTLQTTDSNLDALSLAPWIAVYDFDVNGRENGLLAYMEEGLRRTRSTSVFVWTDPHTGVTERGTQWWSLRGRMDVPDSNLSDLRPLRWLQKVLDKVEKLCIKLAEFCRDYTLLTLLVLWPASTDERKCMQKFISELQKRIHIQPTILLWFSDGVKDQADSFEVQSIANDSEGNVLKFYDQLGGVCKEVENTLCVTPYGTFQYQLPCGENLTADVTLEQAAWLMQDCEVLYIQNPYKDVSLTAEDLQSERENFCKGGSISWYARYDMGTSCFDVERGSSTDIIKHIQEVYIKGSNSGVVWILHAPGAGGTTMSQRILFDLHESTPCVHVKQRTGSSLQEIADRLSFLFEKTNMPVVVLFDGEDEQKMQVLRIQLRRCKIVFLFVKRYPHAIDEERLCLKHKGKFFLPGFVTPKESRLLVVQFRSCCMESPGKIKALNMLDLEVRENIRRHQMFEYGLTVYDHEYKGVKAYVRGYLQMETSILQHMMPWQKALVVLSLANYYAHASLPCQFVGNLMGNLKICKLSDLPHQVKVFVVLDQNEGRKNYIRVMHFAIATEILEQTLNPGSDLRSADGKLGENAKKNVKDFCLDFLNTLRKGHERSSNTCSSVMTILTKLFFSRGEVEMLEDLSETKRNLPKFAQIMLDLDSRPPYNGRLEVFKKLCEVYPDNPYFKAHVGRFFNLCQPDKEEEAEGYFREAIRIAVEQFERMTETRDVQEHNVSRLRNEDENLDLMYIYHMYACFCQGKVKRKIMNLKSLPSEEFQVVFQVEVHDIIANAEQACQNFTLSRNHAPFSMEEAHPYINEIDVRLETCSFIFRNFPGGDAKLLQNWQQFGSVYNFVVESILEVEDLITECYNNAVMDDDELANLQKRVTKFNAVFNGCAHELEALGSEDPVTALRLKVTAKKLQYDTPGNAVFVENTAMPSNVIGFVVETYERIFKYEMTNHDIKKAKLELDFRNWILAIRNPNFSKDYSLETVLDYARQWNRAVKGPQSSSCYYLFVLLSILGFGTSTRAGHEECLDEALRLKESLERQSRGDGRARQTREWLGKEEAPGIRRLISGRTITMDNHRLTGAASGLLAVCKGSVIGKPKRSSAYLNLDLKQRDKKQGVRVFFDPSRSHMTGSPLLQGRRVQFHLAFTQERGYEAFEVSDLYRVKCQQCGLWAEMRRDQDYVLCRGKNCGHEVHRTFQDR